jgi:hypothetical protein
VLGCADNPPSAWSGISCHSNLSGGISDDLNQAIQNACGGHPMNPVSRLLARFEFIISRLEHRYEQDRNPVVYAQLLTYKQAIEMVKEGLNESK